MLVLLGNEVLGLRHRAVTHWPRSERWTHRHCSFRYLRLIGPSNRNTLGGLRPSFFLAWFYVA